MSRYPNVATEALSQCAGDYRQMVDLLFTPTPCPAEAQTQLCQLCRPAASMMVSEEMRLYAAVQADSSHCVYKLQLAIESGELDGELLLWAEALQDAFAAFNEAGRYSELARVHVLTSRSMGQMYTALNSVFVRAGASMPPTRSAA